MFQRYDLNLRAALLTTDRLLIRRVVTLHGTRSSAPDAKENMKLHEMKKKRSAVRERGRIPMTSDNGGVTELEPLHVGCGSRLHDNRANNLTSSLTGLNIVEVVEARIALLFNYLFHPRNRSGSTTTPISMRP